MPELDVLPNTSQLLPQQKCEVRFWHHLAASFPSKEAFRDFRHAEYQDKTRHFEPHWSRSGGWGLEVGCGCVSVLGLSGKTYRAIDPLAEYYAVIAGQQDCSVGTAEDLPFPAASFDWVFCVNMIDHTPDPERALSEMRRVLKPGGTLFFEVHFDATLFAEHFELWDQGMVARRLTAAGFVPLQETVEPVPEHNQKRYWGVWSGQ